MPFRRLFAARGSEHPVAYSTLTFVVGMIVCMVIAVVVSNANTDRAVKQMVTIERQRQADEKAKELADQQKAAQLAETGRAASCKVINIMADAYAKDPPKVPSETYDNVKNAWADLAKFCPKER